MSDAADMQSPSAATVQSGALCLTIVERSDVGHMRAHNEDAVGHRVPSDARQRARLGVLCLVADGMGGHRAGEVASRRALDSMQEDYYADGRRDPATSLRRAFRAANRAIYEQALVDGSQKGMGTTLVAAAIVGDRVHVANVGDSRAYVIGAKGIAQVTDDHSWVEEQVRAGLLTPEQARTHPRRNLVTRALGTRPAVEVDLFEGTLAHGDVLLLCSDGLSGMLDDVDIEAAVRKHPIEEAAQRLVALANERGGTDNITVLLVRAEGAPAPAPPARPSMHWLRRIFGRRAK